MLSRIIEKLKTIIRRLFQIGLEWEALDDDEDYDSGPLLHYLKPGETIDKETLKHD